MYKHVIWSSIIKHFQISTIQMHFNNSSLPRELHRSFAFFCVHNTCYFFCVLFCMHACWFKSRYLFFRNLLLFYVVVVCIRITIEQKKFPRVYGYCADAIKKIMLLVYDVASIWRMCLTFLQIIDSHHEFLHLIYETLVHIFANCINFGHKKNKL